MTHPILRIAKLDLALIKPYFKTMLFILVFPIVFSLIYRSLLGGVSMSMCFAGIASSYAFSISEKNSMERLYHVLPVKRLHLVMGRYLYTGMLGVGMLLLALLLHPLALKISGVTVLPEEILLAVLVGVLLFSMYTVFLLPGYYKFGAIKGRLLVFIPVAGYLAFMFTASAVGIPEIPAVRILAGNSWLTLGAVLILCALAFAASIAVSVRIVKNKEL